jgi:hypothetical protein
MNTRRAVASLWQLAQSEEIEMNCIAHYVNNKGYSLPLQRMMQTNDNVFEQLIERVNLESECGAAIASVSAGQGNGDHAWLDKEGVESEL